MPSLATFNANNFFLRYRFTNTYPGDQSQASRVEAAEVGLDGYLPGIAFGRYTSSFIIWDQQRRQLAVQALMEPDEQLPDILCFQEVENIQAIRVINQDYMGGYYPYSMLIDAYDPRNIDVGLLSRFPIKEVRSHADDLEQNGIRTFSRDCLEVTIDIPGNNDLTIFLNHLKSKFIQRNAGETDASFNQRRLNDHLRRQNQAQTVRNIVSQRMQGNHATALYAVIGDFNDQPESPYLQPLLSYNQLTDILRRHRPDNDCWTYYWRSRNHVSQIDYILVSRALRDRIDTFVQANPNRIPHIERRGLAFRELNATGEVLPRQSNLVHFETDPVTPLPAGATPSEKIDFRFPRYPEVIQDWHNNISDHCPVKVWF